MFATSSARLLGVVDAAVSFMDVFLSSLYLVSRWQQSVKQVTPIVKTYSCDLSEYGPVLDRNGPQI
jgi:hypothetical protein